MVNVSLHFFVQIDLCDDNVSIELLMCMPISNVETFLYFYYLLQFEICSIRILQRRIGVKIPIIQILSTFRPLSSVKTPTATAISFSITTDKRLTRQWIPVQGTGIRPKLCQSRRWTGLIAPQVRLWPSCVSIVVVRCVPVFSSPQLTFELFPLFDFSIIKRH